MDALHHFNDLHVYIINLFHPRLKLKEQVDVFLAINYFHTQANLGVQQAEIDALQTIRESIEKNYTVNE